MYIKKVGKVNRNPLTVKRLKYVLDNVSTLTYNKIAEDLGVSIHSVRKYVEILRKDGLLSQEHTAIVRAKEAEEKLALAIADNSEDSLKKITDMFNIGRPSARKKLNKLTGQKLYNSDTTKIRRDSVLTLYNSGLNINDIASELKATPSLIRADLIVLGVLPQSGDTRLGMHIHNLIMKGFSIKVASISCGISSTKGWLIYKALRLENPTIEEEYKAYKQNCISDMNGGKSKRQLTADDLRVGNLITHFTVDEICERLKLNKSLVNNSIRKLMYRRVIVYDNKKGKYRPLESAIVESFQDGDSIESGCTRLGVTVTRYKSVITKNILNNNIKIECGISVAERRKKIVELREFCSLDTIATIMEISAPTVKRILATNQKKVSSSVV